MGLLDWLGRGRGALHAAEQQVQRAATATERVVALMNRSRARRSLGDRDGALADLDEVIALVPLFGLAYYDRGAIRALKEEPTSAVADLDVAIALLPPGEERAIAYHNRALAREGLNDVPEALRDLHKALAAGWAPAQVEINRICQRFACADDSSLERPADRAAAIDLCEQARGIFARAPLDALVMFTRAAELAPELQEAAHGLGIVNTVLNRIDAALAAFDRALVVQPQKPAIRAETLFNRGQLRSARGDIQGGITDIEACFDLCDRGVGYPCLGDPAKEAAFVAGIRSRLDRLRATGSRSA